MHEVVHWNGYAEQERAAVIGRISKLVRQVSEPMVEIQDQAMLLESLKYQHVRVDELADPYVWFLELLKVGASTIDNLAAYGCALKRPFKDWTLLQIRQQIDADFFTLSEVHYERYFHALPGK